MRASLSLLPAFQSAWDAIWGGFTVQGGPSPLVLLQEGLVMAPFVLTNLIIIVFILMVMRLALRS